MRIGIDVSQIVYGTGVSFYTQYLVKNLLKIDKQSLAGSAGKENEYILFGGAIKQFGKINSLIDSLGCVAPRCSRRIIPFSPKIAGFFWNRLNIFPVELFTGKLDVFHSSDWTQPPTKAFKVTTIHDLAPIIFPKYTDKLVKETHRLRLKKVFREIDRIIVPSNATKNDLVRIGFSEDKIRVIYEAPGEIFKPATEKEIERIKSKYKIRGNYIFCIGTGKRKNMEGTIRGFELSKAGKDLNMVVAGFPEASQEGKRGVRFIGQVEEEELAVLYSGAKCLVYASFYEGFGLPILQAFACGCPVVTSNISSMPEIAGEGAVLVNPEDDISIADGIKKAIASPKGLSKKGFKRVKDFSWEETAKKTLEVYKESQSFR